MAVMLDEHARTCELPAVMAGSLADQLLSEEEQATRAERFQETEDRVCGRGARERLTQELARLERGGPA
jgi:hypothetical protein